LDEICSLVWDCLEYDEHDRLPILIYDNHKAPTSAAGRPPLRPPPN
jgi:hypothetical protein